MKIVLIGLLCLFSSISYAADDQEVDADDPCAVTMCMFGMLTEGGDASECSDPIAKFFGIQVWDSWDGFDPSATADERKKFLKQCDHGVDNEIGGIIDKFGEMI